jgi:hypothetical protein
MRNVVLWDVMPCDSCKNRRFGGRIESIIRITKVNELGTKLAVSSSRWTPCISSEPCYVLLTFLLARRFFSPWWWRRYLLRNVSCYKSHMVSHPRRRCSVHFLCLYSGRTKTETISTSLCWAIIEKRTVPIMLCNPETQCRDHNIPPLVTVLSQIYQIHSSHSIF